MPNKKSRTPAAQWVPYHRLPAYFAWQEKTTRSARKKANGLADLAFGTSRAPLPTTRPSAVEIERMRDCQITPGLRSVLLAPRSESRRRLDHLILAYARAGYTVDDALRETGLDYQSMDNVPPLAAEEIASYATLFWDFLPLFEREVGLEYLETWMPGSDELRIYTGSLSLASVRASVCVVRLLARPDFGSDLVLTTSLAFAHVMRHIHEETARLDAADVKELKDLALLASSLGLSINRLTRGQELGEGTDEGFGLLEDLFQRVETDRERRRAEAPGFPWDDPSMLIRSDRSTPADVNGESHEE